MIMIEKEQVNEQSIQEWKGIIGQLSRTGIEIYRLSEKNIEKSYIFTFFSYYFIPENGEKGVYRE